MKRLSFITQFKTEFLLPFTGCRKLIGKMPAFTTHRKTVCQFCAASIQSVAFVPFEDRLSIVCCVKAVCRLCVV